MMRKKSHSKVATKPVTKHHRSATLKCCNCGQPASLARVAKQNLFFHLIIDGINPKSHALKAQGREEKKKHTRKTEKNHLATFCLQDTHLGLAFILGDGVLDFVAEGGKETTASPSGATMKCFICFCCKAHKSRAFTVSPG